LELGALVSIIRSEDARGGWNCQVVCCLLQGNKHGAKKKKGLIIKIYEEKQPVRRNGCKTANKGKKKERIEAKGKARENNLFKREEIRWME
jgi:hypothetical protein